MESFLQRILAYTVSMLPGVLAAAMLFFCLRPWRRRRLREASLVSGGLREVCLLCLFLFSGGMAALTLLPDPTWFWSWMHGYWTPLFGAWALPVRYRVNLLPFSQGDSLVNLLGNLVMFMPFGLSLPLLWRGWNGRRVLLADLAITGAIECWQLLIGRFFDVDDILLNTLGVLCGFWLWRGRDRCLPKGLRQLRCKRWKVRVEPCQP